jgi:lipopolysaccharide export system protein LptC
VTTVLDIHDKGAHAFTAARRFDTRRLFRAAKRHSRFVRVLRVALPLAVLVGGVGGVVVTAWLDPLRALARLPVNIGGVVVSGTKITMQQPRMAGFTRDSRPYVMTARTATQDVTVPDVLELVDIHATMESRDRGAFEVTASTGHYETKAEKLTLHKNIVVNSGNFDAFLTEAVVYVQAGRMVSEQPVEVKMMQGTINSNRMEVLNSGETVRFQGDVIMNVTETPPPPRVASKGSTR